MTTKKVPFQNLTMEAWQNLALVGLATFYIITSLFEIMKTYLITFGSDYLAFWSAGLISNQLGYAKVYSLENLSVIQSQLAPNRFPVFGPVPAPYLPVFFVPFQLMALLPFSASLWLWDLLNLILFVAYLSFYIYRLGANKNSNKRAIIFLLFSLPVFYNIFWAQLNLWLMICVGELTWQLWKDKPFLAGLWVGGLLLKPQLLILLIPALIWKRSWGMLRGFFVSTFFIILTSIMLLGARGVSDFSSMGRLWFEPKLNSTVELISPFRMMNWRMVGEHVSKMLSPSFGWIIMVIGSIITLMGLYFLLRQFNKKEQIPATMLGLFSATVIVTWHSHYHMAMVLIPPLLFLFVQNRIKFQVILLWVFIPPIVYFLSTTGAYLIDRTGSLIYHSYLFVGLSMLTMSLYLMMISYKSNLPANTLSHPAPDGKLGGEEKKSKQK